MGFTLYHTFQETENRASGSDFMFPNQNTTQIIVTLNRSRQYAAVKVTAHKTITLCSGCSPSRNHFNFNPNEKSRTDQLPSVFIPMGDRNGHHTWWRCEDANNGDQELEDLILKNYSMVYNDKSCTYFHSGSGTFSSIDLTLCSASICFCSTSRGKLVQNFMEVTTSLYCWRTMDLLMKGFKDLSCRMQIGINSSIYATLVFTNLSLQMLMFPCIYLLPC